MKTISNEAYEFLLEFYKSKVEEFFDDPIGYSDGNNPETMFNVLKKLGKEFKIDILSLAQLGDFNLLQEQIKKYKNLKGYELHNSVVSNINDKIIDDNQNIEIKLKQLSKNKQLNEMVGEWTTYNVEEK